ncbi:relaxase domain-containing protein [Streptosporangium canum]|uniref:relaxase domain-containing protein n=1 Tax=Streptosporangium canum TaxID=324952 RepID=UPI0037AFD9DE
MAWITDLGPSAAQVEYRLRGGVICDRRHSIDGAPQPIWTHRSAPDGEDGREPLYEEEPTWFGSALQSFGLVRGSRFTPAQHHTASALMGGRHPSTGRRLLATADSTRNRGFEITLAQPASVSTLYVLGRPDVAASVTELVTQAVMATASHLEQQIVRHSRRAGLMGWIIQHLTMPPLNGDPPRPCLHAHLVIAALMRAPDGEWSDITGACRRALYEGVEAADAYARDKVRHLLTDHHGVAWERDRRTGRWEIASASADLYESSPRRLFGPQPGHFASADDSRRLSAVQAGALAAREQLRAWPADCASG